VLVSCCCVLDALEFAAPGLISILFLAFFYAFYRNQAKTNPLRRRRERSLAVEHNRGSRARGQGALFAIASAERSPGDSLWLCVLQHIFYLLLTWLPATCLPFITSIYFIRASTRVFPALRP